MKHNVDVVCIAIGDINKKMTTPTSRVWLWRYDYLLTWYKYRSRLLCAYPQCECICINTYGCNMLKNPSAVAGVCPILNLVKDNPGYRLSQWKTTLQLNVFHWMSNSQDDPCTLLAPKKTHRVINYWFTYLNRRLGSVRVMTHFG